MRPRPPTGGVVEARGQAFERLIAADELLARVPGRAWPHSTPGRVGARLAAMTVARNAPHPGQHAERAAGRGVALLHEVAADDGLPVGARPRGAAGARCEQAAAPDGPADRVLQPDRRARPGPVRRRRRHAARGGHRARPATGASASSSNRAGRRSSKTVVRDLDGERDGAGPVLADLGRPIRAGRAAFDPGGLELRVGDALARPADDRDGLDRLRRDRPAVQPRSCR